MDVCEDIRRERKAWGLSPARSHQVMLVGSNPLPCYVAALALRPQRITFVYSGEVGGLTEELKKALEEERIQCNKAKMIQDTSSSGEIADVIRCIPGIETAGLHYTAGKKTMSVHAHRAWLEKARDITQASYLDAQKKALIFDDRDLQIDLPREPKVAFDTLVALHRITPRKTTPYKTEVQHPGLSDRMRQSVKSLGLEGLWKKWPPRNVKGEALRKEALKDKNSKDKAICLKYSLETFQGIRDHFKTGQGAERYDFLSFSRDFGQVGKALSEIPGLKKLQSAFKWLDGLWLEEYTWEQISGIAEACGLHDVIYDVNMDRSGKRDFQYDVACMRGHTLFAFSCTTSNEKNEWKFKLFEIQARARQLGGDHARYALVCLGPDGQVEALKKDIEHNWDAGNYVYIFGWEEVMDNLGGKIQEWIDSV